MMIPKDWERYALGKITETITSGSRDWAQYYSDVGSKFIRMTNLPRDGIYLKLDDLKYVDVKSDSSDGQRTSLNPGDILISITAELGKIGWVPDNLGEAFINQHTALVRLKSKFTDPKFVAYLLSSKEMNHKINRLNDSGAKAGLNLSTIRAIPLSLPPLPEQRKIAAILSTWDKAISTTEQLLANSQQQKKALMQQLLTGKKRLLDEKGERFTGGWREFLVEEYFDVGSSKRVLQNEWQTEGIPFYRTRELVSLAKKEPFRSEIFISEELFSQLSKKYGCPKSGDFLISGVGTLGISYQVKEGDRFYFKDGNVLWFKLNGEIHSDYFKYAFQSDFIQDQIMTQASVTTVGTYTIQNAKKTKLLCPPTLGEQKKIAAVLTTADQEIETLQGKLEALKQEKKALMQQLLTGKRRVKVDEVGA